MPSKPSKNIEIIKNPARQNYLIEMECPEFTCLCPKTGQPDFATLRLTYVPQKMLVELKSLKTYLWSFRNEGHFHEAVINQIGDFIYRSLNPKYLKLIGDFYVRGGIHTVITVTRGKMPKDINLS